MVYSARLAGKRLRFGISGLLYKSNVLLYDRESGSLWSQLAGSAVSGKFSGTRLVELPSQTMTWVSWARAHPETKVAMAVNARYESNPYETYGRSPDLMFDVGPIDPRLQPKELVFGIVIGSKAKAYPIGRLPGSSAYLVDRVDGAKVRLLWNAQAHSVRAEDATGKALAGSTLFWFAWSQFHPDTDVYTAP